MTKTGVMSEQVWITGLGAVTPIGNTYAEIADALLNSRSGIRQVQDEKSPVQIAARVGDIPPPPAWDPQAFGQLDSLEQLVLSCCGRALADAGWWDRRFQVRVGLVMGLTAEWLRVWEMDRYTGGNRIYDPQRDQEPLLNTVRRKLELKGPTLTVAAACASGNVALAQARTWLRMGWVDVCLAGGCEIVSPMSMAVFGNLRALSRRCDDPPGASRPFDRDRDGFVMGEGGAMFVLESAQRARARGAKGYAEIAGYGATSDASHMIIPSSDPSSSAQAVRTALSEAKANPDDVDYLNAHATSTLVGDRAETNALKLALGEATKGISVSSTKSMTGHLLSAAAAMEAVACLVALDRQAVPPTINLDNPDPQCELRHVPHFARQQNVRLALSNSFGFGGTNTCLALRKAG